MIYTNVKFTNSEIKLLSVMISFVAQLLHVRKIDCASNNCYIKQHNNKHR